MNGFKKTSGILPPTAVKHFSNAANIGAGLAAGGSAIEGVDNLLDDKKPDGGILPAALNASETAGWLHTMPAVTKRVGVNGRGVLGGAGVAGNAIGAVDTINSGINSFSEGSPIIGTGQLGLAGMQGYIGYTGARDFVASPVGKKSIDLLNNAAKGTYNTAKNVINSAPSVAPQVAANVAPTAARTVAREGEHLAAKAVGKFGAKAVGKYLPIAGLGIGLYGAGERAMAGDWPGAGAEALSGAASTFPGYGTAASMAIDGALLTRDLTKDQPVAAKPSNFPVKPTVPTSTAPSPAAGVPVPSRLPAPKSSTPTITPNVNAPTNNTATNSSVTPKPVVPSTQIKVSELRRNTGINQDGNVWVNPEDRKYVEKLGFCWEDYQNLPPSEQPETLKEFFNL